MILQGLNQILVPLVPFCQRSRDVGPRFHHFERTNCARYQSGQGAFEPKPHRSKHGNAETGGFRNVYELQFSAVEVGLQLEPRLPLWPRIGHDDRTIHAGELTCPVKYEPHGVGDTLVRGTDTDEWSHGSHCLMGHRTGFGGRT